MLQRITERLTIPGPTSRVLYWGPPLAQTEGSNSLTFEFEMWRKSTTFGDIPIEHFWMAPNSIYGQRRQQASNHKPVVAYFWNVAVKEGLCVTSEVLETFILAQLLPVVRSNGSRRVFADARPDRKRNPDASKQAIVSDLDQMLCKTRCNQLTKFEFNEKTAELLGPPAYGAEVRACYNDFAQKLLERTCDAMEKEGLSGLGVAKAQWDAWTCSIGRRRGNEVQKQVLDVFSYECRAALHRCYAAVWFDLIQQLANQGSLNAQSVLFHRLWHLDLQDRTDDRRSVLPNNRLFHGHILALHPACGNFILTPTGQEMIGNVLRSPWSQLAFRRLLHGLLIAMHDYAVRHDVYRELRKEQATSLSTEQLEQAATDRISGRRRSRAPRDQT